jgi:hypothetical protein
MQQLDYSWKRSTFYCVSYYRQVAIDNIEKAVSSINASSAIHHSLQRGRLREIVVSELIQPFLTPHTKVATGAIIDHYGNQSNPLDIILYDERITPPVLLTASEGIIPCHSVLATIEVRTKMNKTELKKAVDNARSVKLLKYDYDNLPLSSERGFEVVFHKRLLKLIENDNLREQIYHHLFDVSSPATYIFAFTSDLSKQGTIEDEKDRLVEEVAESNRNGDEIKVPVNGICIADAGYAHCSAFSPNPTVVKFESELPSPEQPRRKGRKYWASYNVVLKLEASLMNTCAEHSLQRWRIPLDVYFKQ